MALLKAKNAKDWKTTTLSIIAGVVVIAGIIWPDKLDPETGEAINAAAANIISGVGVLIVIIVGMFGSKDGDKD